LVNDAASYKKDFWNTANLKFGEPWYRLRKAAAVVAALAGDDRRTLLDLGCGPGTLGELLPANIEYYGIDIAVHSTAPNFREADIVHVPVSFDGRRFDLITALGLFEYVEDAQSRKFAEIARLLTGDGKFVVTYTNFGHRKHRIYEAFTNVQPLADFRRDLNRFFVIERSFPASHNWKHSQPDRRLVKAVNMRVNTNIPLLSPLLAVDYFFVCSPRPAPAGARLPESGINMRKGVRIRPAILLVLSFLMICGFLAIPRSAVANAATTSASDNFARANGSLGSNWQNISDGGLAISSDSVVGTNATGNSGDIWSANSFTSDQYSTITLTSTQLTGTQWIGTAVRAQSGGQDAYVGIYYWNNGSPMLELFDRSNGNWTQIGDTASVAALPAGSKLTLTAVGNTLSFNLNGTPEVTSTDNSLTGGQPGIIANGAARAATWAGGNAGFSVTLTGTDSTGIKSYQVLSANNGYGPQTLRVLQPTHPASGVPHNFLLVLPVEPGLGTSFGDGLAAMQSADAEDQYNLTIVEPTFQLDPWYANNPNDPNLQYETFLTNELVPWMKANLGTTGNEQTWLIGFSKSGIGAQDLILKHPDVYTLAASWDFPADISSYDQFPDSSAVYGTAANFSSNYQLTQSFLQAHASAFTSSNRIWIGSYNTYGTDVSDYASRLTTAGIEHTTETPTEMAHSWSSGWVPGALAALNTDSKNLPSSGGGGTGGCVLWLPIIGCVL
jgi:SAM-dependent methyltransferase